VEATFGRSGETIAGIEMPGQAASTGLRPNGRRKES